MIIRYYKGFISLSKLEEMLKTTRNGTTAYHIVNALKQLGFNAYGIKLNKLRETKVPFIANVIIESSYKHYIVVYEVTGRYVRIADPASKIKKISKEEFYKIWTGINIEMYPERIIVNEKPKTVLNVLKLINFNKKQIFIIGFLSLIITFLAIVSSFFFQLLIDNMDKNINDIIIFFLMIFLIKIVFDYIRETFLIKFIYDIDNHLTKKIFERIIMLPYRYYHNHTTGEVISKINDLASLRDVLGKMVLTVFIDFPLTLFSGILLFILNKTLFLIALIILILYILIILICHKNINYHIDKSLQDKACVNSFMVESISGFETVKGLNIENKIYKLFNKKYDNYIETITKLNYLTNRQTFFKNMINDLGISLILVLGINLVTKGYMNLSTLITYNILVSFFLEPIKNIIDLDFEIKEVYNSLNRILDLIDVQSKERYKTLKGLIEIKNLWFSLDDINYILKGISFKIKDQNKVLITGKSGSGKSTLLKIIKGYYDDYKGRAMIDGKKIEIGSNIIYISQKEILFTGTINYNLTLKGNDNLEVIKSICHIDDITCVNELGDNMLLEEDGFNISGGQRQRIALARSLHGFDILLIDEGLSGLDVNLERKILKKLFKEYNNKTIVIISHRLDNLDLFDQYIKLEEGKIILDSSLPGKGE